jgi:hypothetical protein
MNTPRRSRLQLYIIEGRCGVAVLSWKALRLRDLIGDGTGRLLHADHQLLNADINNGSAVANQG